MRISVRLTNSLYTLDTSIDDHLKDTFFKNINSIVLQWTYSKIPLKRPPNIKTILVIKTMCFNTEMQLSMQVGLMIETCLLLRQLSISAIDGLFIGTSLY